MATRGSKSVVLAPHLTLKWSWEVKSRDVANKLTTVNWKAEVIADESGSITSYTSVPWTFRAFHVASNTTLETDSGSAYMKVEANGTKEIASGSFDVATNCSYKFELDHGTLATVLGKLPTNQYVESSFVLDAYPQGVAILSAPKFTDEENPVLKYSIDSSEVTEVTGKMQIGYTTIATRTLPISTSGEYTFELTEAERNAIRNKVTDSNYADVTFTVSVKLYNQTLSDSLDGQVQIVNAAAVLNPSYTINGGYTYILAEQNSISVAANATAQKGATIKSYLITCGNKQIKAASGTFTNISSNIISFTVTDSRGIQSATSLTLDMIPYVKLSCNIESTNPVENADGTITVTFNVSGAFYEGDFRDGGSGNALSLYYRYKLNDSYEDWEWVNSDNVNVSNNSYSFSLSRTVQPTHQITIEVQAQDNINTVTATLVSKELLPIFDWSRSDFNFNVPVYIKGNEVPYIVDSGTTTHYPNGTFYWRKWSDGSSEFWGRTSFSKSFKDNNWGSLSTTGEISESNISFPTGLFTVTPVIVAQLLTGATGGILMSAGNGVDSSKSNTGEYEIARGNYPGTSSFTFTISYMVRGRWK